MSSLPFSRCCCIVRRILLSFLTLISAAGSAGAWTATAYLDSSGNVLYDEVNLPTNSYSHWVYVPGYNTSNPPTFYFCVEFLPINPAGASNTAIPQLWFRTTTTPATPAPNGTISKYDLGTWTPVSGQTSTQTFAYPATQPSGYTILAPSSPTGLQYVTGYRFYGKVKGQTTANTAFVMPYWTVPTNGSIKLTISDQPLLEGREPDVVAQPVTSALGEPSILVNGVADKHALPSPSNYTLTWDAAGATSFNVSGGYGNGALVAGGYTTGTSRSLTSVTTSTQTYVITTQGSATVAWKLSPAGYWEIRRGSTLLASGNGTLASASTTQAGAHSIRVHGITKTAEDETVNVTDGFLKRKKTVELKVGNP